MRFIIRRADTRLPTGYGVSTLDGIERALNLFDRTLSVTITTTVAAAGPS
jgi:hypothetical protein